MNEVEDSVKRVMMIETSEGQRHTRSGDEDGWQPSQKKKRLVRWFFGRW